MEMTRDRADPKSSGSAFVCGKCGAKIFGTASSRYCPACLLESGLQRDESAPQKEPILAEFGDYELLEEIGRGGQGIVYRARQKSLNRLVALKIVGLGYHPTEAHLKRFRREAEAAARLQHPQIIPIYEIGEREGTCYFSMKLEEGGQLDQFVRHGTISLRRAAEIIASLARTVQYAHERGILHRDIKPGNILLDAQGEPHLADFGLVRLVESDSTVTRTEEVLGTPSYIAPEQAAGQNDKVTSATDVYGLGAVFYQLLTSHPPFAGGTTYETIRLVLETEPRNPRLWNPKIDRDLTTICLKCLEKDPARRFKSALDFAEDLERWLRHEPIQARRTGLISRGGKWIRRNTTTAALAASLVALSIASGWIIWKSELTRNPRTTGIAVLPFENLSDEKEHAFFADGVQDDILTKLAKIADLKVISRSSIMQYRGNQDVRKIANALGVSHVLEGTVRRIGEKVHVNAELVDTRTDAGIWAEEYDRNLNDVFAIETEVAQSIVSRLRAKVSPREKAAMQEWPTKDLGAYDFYVRAIPLLDGIGKSSDPDKDLSMAVGLLNEAVRRDPSFFLAYCRLAEAHDGIYFFTSIDHTPGRLALAKSAIDSAFRLKPNAGEAHLALAVHFYRGYTDYDHARAELDLAQHALPNDPKIFSTTALIDRRQGRWSEALHNFERASELDPRNAFLLTSLAGACSFARAYDRADNALARVLAINPHDSDAQLSRAFNAIVWRADTRSFRAAIEKIKADNPAFGETDGMKDAMFMLAAFDHDFATASRIAETFPECDPTDEAGLGRAFSEGLIARMKGDTAAARSAFTNARTTQEEAIRAQPDNTKLLCGLALIDAGLGRKEEAMREGRRAVELMPVAKDSLDGPIVLTYFAQICAWTGERDLAIEQLEVVTKIPAGPHYGGLRLDPVWDPLRGDPRFEKIVASLKPKAVSQTP
jgi:serine/threonine-protein kinase